MPQKGLVAWGFFLAGNLDVSERKVRERRLPCEQQEGGETGRALFKPEELRVSRLLCRTGQEEGGLLADRGEW